MHWCFPLISLEASFAHTEYLRGQYPPLVLETPGKCFKKNESIIRCLEFFCNNIKAGWKVSLHSKLKWKTAQFISSWGNRRGISGNSMNRLETEVDDTIPSGDHLQVKYEMSKRPTLFKGLLQRFGLDLLRAHYKETCFWKLRLERWLQSSHQSQRLIWPPGQMNSLAHHSRRGDSRWMGHRRPDEGGVGSF